MEISRFELSVSATSGGASYLPKTITSGGYADLVPGKYDITVTAFKGSVEIAEGTKPGVIINESLQTPVSIILGPKADAGNGTLEYDLTIPENIPDPILSITTLTGGAISGGTILLTPGERNHNSLNLPSGYYKAQLVLNWGSTVAGFNNEFVHIYSGLTSVLSRTFTAFTPQTVKAYDLTSFFPAPIIGVDPVVTFEGAQYDGVIQWKANGMDHNGPFEGNTVYTAEITLVPDIAYTFKGVGANVFFHNGMISETNKADSGVLTIVFPQALATVTAGKVLDIVFNYEQVKLDISGSDGVNAIYQSVDPKTLSLTVNGDYQDMSWYVDGSKEFITTNPLYLEAAKYIIGPHIVTFNGSKEGIPFSQQVDFIVADSVISLDNLDAGAEAFSQEDFTLTGTGSKSISIATGYSNPRWFVDGTQEGTADTITINTTDYSVGSHKLSLLIDKDGSTWSKEITFTIIKDFTLTGTEIQTISSSGLGYTKPRWKVDADGTEKGGTEITIKAADYSVGSHTLFLKDANGSWPTNGLLTFTIIKDFILTGTESKTISIKSEYTGSWSVDEGTPQGGTTITINAADYTSTGNHTLALSITKDGSTWSKESKFTIIKDFTLIEGESQLIKISGSGYTNPPNWIVGDIQKGTGPEITINAADYSVGDHTLLLNIGEDGRPPQRQISFTIFKDFTLFGTESQTISSSGYIDPSWTVDTDELDPATITIAAADYDVGEHTLLLKESDNSSSKAITFSIFKDFELTGTESKTISISGSEYTNPIWKVDGNQVGTGTTIDIGAEDYDDGEYTLTLSYGSSLSKAIKFTVD
jgi:hypothetical protein